MSKLPTLTRRDFLKASACTGLVLATGHTLVYPAGKAWGTIDTDPSPDLAVVTGNPEKAVLKALTLLGGMKRFVKKGQKVVIKPNMSFAKTPDDAANTSPIVVATVARACIDAGAKSVLVVDHTLQKPELFFELSGIR